MESGNRDSSRFVLKNRDEWQVCIPLTGEFGISTLQVVWPPLAQRPSDKAG